MKQLEAIFERLIATAIDATMIVVESQLHGDPVPSLRSHYKRIVEERARLYASYLGAERREVDALLRARGERALDQEFRSDTRKGHEVLRGTLLDVLFWGAECGAAEQPLG